MAIPSPASLISKTKTAYGQKLGPEAEELLKALFGAVTDGWKEWQDSMSFGGFSVTGAGVGAFSGSGVGGKLKGSPYKMPDFSFKGNSPQMKKFAKGLADALAQKFTPFPDSYSMPAIVFTGTSGATTTSPGPVSAQNAPATLATAGSGTNPSGIANLWKGFLTPPDFDLANPQCKSGDLVKAIAKTIEQEFKLTWLMTTQLTGNTLSTTGAAGGTVTAISTPMNGKLS